MFVDTGSLEAGFSIPGLRLHVLGDREIFGQPAKRVKLRAIKEGVPVTLADLQVGDYVVHAVHGIGQYLGLRTETILGAIGDYMDLKYAGTDRMLVPVHQMHQVTKYGAHEGAAPKLSKMGGADWARTKGRVSEALGEDRRRSGRALRRARDRRPDTRSRPTRRGKPNSKRRFRTNRRPIKPRRSTKRKPIWNAPRPMDRLVCGDVGYGKTEVAVRATFKAIADKKQVAILVPTTLLASQHYRTFTARFASFPVRIDELSRFKSKKEQQATLAALADGQVDVVVGTHRLLQKDVVFRDLGLDRRRRRTALRRDAQGAAQAAARDGRRADALGDADSAHAADVADGRARSLADSHGAEEPHVDQDGRRARRPTRSCSARSPPNSTAAARCTTCTTGSSRSTASRARSSSSCRRRASRSATGRCTSTNSSRSWRSFIDGEIDVLVATTIIENGIDIPNVNTIVVNDADKFGLAQLYQLRGRVGRSNHQAYAFLLYQAHKALTEEAKARLEAIREFTHLGSGLQIAMRDLEIRGAGNLLGAAQSGFIGAVGFETYAQLLAEAIVGPEGRARRRLDVREAVIDVKIDAFVPNDYIPQVSQKIAVYQQLAAARTLADVEDIVASVRDRFGPLPEPLENLVEITRLRVFALAAGVTRVVINEQRLTLGVGSGFVLDPAAIPRLQSITKNRFRFGEGKITIDLPARSAAEQLPTLHALLNALTSE